MVCLYHKVSPTYYSFSDVFSKHLTAFLLHQVRRVCVYSIPGGKLMGSWAKGQEESPGWVDIKWVYFTCIIPTPSRRQIIAGPTSQTLARRWSDVCWGWRWYKSVGIACKIFHRVWARGPAVQERSATARVLSLPPQSGGIPGIPPRPSIPSVGIQRGSRWQSIRIGRDLPAAR